MIEHVYGFYDHLLKTELKEISSWSTLDFLLDQLDRWTRCYFVWRTSDSPSAVLNRTQRDELPLMRRSLKHVVEVLCAMKPSLNGRKLVDPRAFGHLERVFIAAKLMFQLSNTRDQTYKLFPNSTIATVNAEDDDIYLDVKLEPKQYSSVEKHYERQHQFLALRNRRYRDLFPDNPEYFRRFDTAFVEDIGCSLSAVDKTLSILQEQVSTHPEAHSPFVLRSNVIENVSAILSIPPTVVERVIGIFTLRADSYTDEPPELWRIKRKNRVSRKPLVLVHHASGDHLAWSPLTIGEARMSFVSDLAARKLPAELMNCPSIVRTAEKVHQDVNWGFEQLVFGELEKRGLVGRHGVRTRSLGLKNGQRVIVPPAVGEIDLLLLHQEHRILFVGECKNTAFAPEVSQWYEDIQDFVSSRKAYRTKFLRKIEWIEENILVVLDSLCHEVNVDPEGEWSVLPVMITSSPSFASHLIQEFLCLSVYELLESLDDHPDGLSGLLNRHAEDQ